MRLLKSVQTVIHSDREMVCLQYRSHVQSNMICILSCGTETSKHFVMCRYLVNRKSECLIMKDQRRVGSCIWNDTKLADMCYYKKFILLSNINYVLVWVAFNLRDMQKSTNRLFCVKVQQIYVLFHEKQRRSCKVLNLPNLNKCPLLIAYYIVKFNHSHINESRKLKVETVFFL